MRFKKANGIHGRLAARLRVATGAENRFLTCAAAAAFALAAWSSAANASPVSTVNVQFTADAGDYTGQGALTTPDAHDWNSIIITPPSTLEDSNGNSTSVTISTTNSFLYSPGSTLDTSNDLIDQCQADYSTGDFTIGGLSTTTTYDLYLYGWTHDSGGSYGTKFDIISSAGSNTNP